MKMRRLVSCLLLVFPFSNHAQTSTPTGDGSSQVVQPSQSAYSIVQAGPHSRVWQKVTASNNSRGRILLKTNSYVELGVGINHLQNGKWVESTEDIQITPTGAAATNAQCQADFPPDIYSGAVTFVTADSKTLTFRPLMLSYFDGTNSVLLAEITNSPGAILPSGNQVIYPNAFPASSGLSGDIMYSFTRSGIEQNVILRSWTAPSPAMYGLNPTRTRLQVLTEFFSPPPPNQTTTALPQQAGISLADDNLDFGSTKIGLGRAFLLGTDPGEGVLVAKEWVQLSGRQFLIEEVPLAALSQQLQALPTAVAMASVPSARRSAGPLDSILPPPRLIEGGNASRFQMAKAEPSQTGFLIDFQTLTASATNFIFQGDTTYYISSGFAMFGTNILEGGTCIKFTNGASLSLVNAYGYTSKLITRTSPYRTAVLTSKDDNSVGEGIGGSTGNPTGFYAATALALDGTGSQSLTNCRISFAQRAITCISAPVTLYDFQFVNCQSGLNAGIGSCLLRNVLFSNTQTNFVVTAPVGIDAQNVTFDQSSCLGKVSLATTFNLTNCIFAYVTNYSSGSLTLNGAYNGFYVSGGNTTFGSPAFTSPAYPFQWAGAGWHYLADNSFRGRGTNAIDPGLLTDLRKRTTWPPLVSSNTPILADTVVNVQAQLDTSIPDLGFHYSPLDYLITGFTNSSSALTLASGVAVGCYGSSGISFGGGSALNSVGTPSSRNQICSYQAVQEQPMMLAGISPSQMLLLGFNAEEPPIYLSARFTDFNGLSGISAIGSGSANPYPKVQVTLRDCFVGPGVFGLESPAGGATRPLSFTNNVFERASLHLGTFDYECPIYFNNNTVRGGSIIFDDDWAVNSYRIFQDNLFDNTTVSAPYPQLDTYDHNAYYKSTNSLTPPHPGDVTLTALVYATSPQGLGCYYIGTSSPNSLVNAGHTNADMLGLYHFTIQTNVQAGLMIKETNSLVDIGFHYVATGSSGSPIDSDSDGIPDYLEDANGNGTVDSGENSWTNYSSANRLVAGNGLQVFTPLK